MGQVMSGTQRFRIGAGGDVGGYQLVVGGLEVTAGGACTGESPGHLEVPGGQGPSRGDHGK